jgi:ElaB/YqjD/DUF883 family membrane-anchored ribosome-binding protein
MATKETARLEHEAEQTRARLEQTLGELRARMSPGQLMDQATDYFRHNSARAFVSNLRDEVVHNPVPVALIGAGIAWLALSGTMGRRRNGDRMHMERDWGETSATAQDLAHGGGGISAAERARRTAEGWVDDARDAVSDMGERASTAYDETIGRARETAADWSEGASATAHDVRERAADMYDETKGGVRRMARKAAGYGRAARDAVQPDGSLVNFCREQPMLVAGLGLAVGAALAAMIPSSRAERQVMGETSREVQDRIKETASDTWRAIDGERSGQEASGSSEHEQGSRSEDRFERAANDSGPTATQQSNIGRSEQPSFAKRGQDWDRDTMSLREAAADVERGAQQGDRASNLETDPERAHYAEAAEAGGAGSRMPGEETKQRT